MVPQQAGAARVLVVDDNADALELMTEALQLVGYEAVGATDGPEALARAAEARPQLALLDIGLPVMDGYELAQRLREILPRIKLVAVTGYGLAADRRRSAQVGFDEHLVKPVTMATVQSVIARLVAQ